MDKKTPKTDKNEKKVLKIKAVAQPQNILTLETDKVKLEKLMKITSNLVMLTSSNGTLVFIKGKSRKIQKYNPYAVTGPKEPIVEMIVPQLFAIDYVIPTKPRDDWEEELLKNKNYQTKRKFWENLGVNYIIDFDINSINKSLQEDK